MAKTIYLHCFNQNCLTWYGNVDFTWALCDIDFYNHWQSSNLWKNFGVEALWRPPMHAFINNTVYCIWALLKNVELGIGESWLYLSWSWWHPRAFIGSNLSVSERLIGRFAKTTIFWELLALIAQQSSKLKLVGLNLSEWVFFVPSWAKWVDWCLLYSGLLQLHANTQTILVCWTEAAVNLLVVDKCYILSCCCTFIYVRCSGWTKLI